LVAIIDELLARKYWPKGKAVGGRFMRGVREFNQSGGQAYTVIGVVGSVKNGDLAEQNPVGQFYFDYKQYVPRAVRLTVRTMRDDPLVTAAIRRELQRADPEIPLLDVKTMPERLSQSVQNRRAAMVLCLLFAGIALALAAVGIYGVLAYAVTQRTREFGVRLALGAPAREVVGMVVGQGVRLALIGLLAGIAGALALTRLMTSILFDVKPGDPTVFVAMALGLMAVALGASAVPSLRAVRIQPASALRHE